MVSDGSDVYWQLAVILPDAPLEGGRVEYFALEPQSHHLVGENHGAPLTEQLGGKLEEVVMVEVAVAEVGFGIEVALDDSDGLNDALPDKDAEPDVLSKSVLRATRSVPGVKENVYTVRGQA